MCLLWATGVHLLLPANALKLGCRQPYWGRISKIPSGPAPADSGLSRAPALSSTPIHDNHCAPLFRKDRTKWSWITPSLGSQFSRLLGVATALQGCSNRKEAYMCLFCFLYTHTFPLHYSKSFHFEMVLHKKYFKVLLLKKYFNSILWGAP